MLVEETLHHRALAASELRAIVDAVHHRGVRRDGDDALTTLRREADDVRQVVLALRVVRLQRRERVFQELHARGVDAGVPLFDRALLVGPEVLLLADLEDPSLRVTHHAPVAERIVRRARRDRDRRGSIARAGGRVVERGRHCCDVGGGEQRHVAIEDEDALGVLAHRVKTRSCGIAGPALLLLDRGLHAGSPRFGDVGGAGSEGLREIRFEAFSTVANHHDDFSTTCLEGGAYGVVDEWTASDGVEHLRQGALHPGALTGSQDERSRLLEPFRHGAPFAEVMSGDGGDYATRSQLYTRGSAERRVSRVGRGS